MAPLAGDRDQLAVHIRRRRAWRAGAKARRVPLPDDLQVREVRGIDLIRLGVACMPGITADIRPLTVLDSRSLRHNLGRDAHQPEGNDEPAQARRLSGLPGVVVRIHRYSPKDRRAYR